jgi:benzoyl-CoA reductase/2-hydroxyglutaryl-CoA dehydratase subunit BcrC/BadD/HgdB
MISPKPERISAAEWDERFHRIPEAYRLACRHLRSIPGFDGNYLAPPSWYAGKGDRLLDRLKFDSSPAALRLWAFVFSEKDRLFGAKKHGWNVFAAMKDLGITPIMTYAIPKTVTFYADELWWAPCFAENPNLLDVASGLGATDELCYVRAALGAMLTGDYFPEPDLCIAGVGSCCDDFSAVMQLIEWQGFKVHWWEMPSKLPFPKTVDTGLDTKTAGGGVPYKRQTLEFITKELRSVADAAGKVAGHSIEPSELTANIRRFNRLRTRIRELRDKVYGAEHIPLPGLEMFLAEFNAIHGCSDPDESLLVLDDLHAEVDRRLALGQTPFHGNPVRIYWVTPPTDASLITLLEDAGGVICGSEYLISHSFFPLQEEGDPYLALAENHLDDPMTGSCSIRTDRIIREALKYRAEGVIISGIFGASHCPFEEKRIIDEIREQTGLPALSFDVPFSPGRTSEQARTRIEGFLEVVRGRRVRTDHQHLHSEHSEGMTMKENEADIQTDPFEYFANSIEHELEFVETEKRSGRKIAGIYCEYTPRELILAAGALPVCLCGTSNTTIPEAEKTLPSNLCPLIKSSFGYFTTGSCPFIEMADILIAETTCDGKKKMYEIMAAEKRMDVLELTQKSDSIEALNHWKSEIRRLKGVLEAEFDVSITDAALHDAIRTMNEERALLKRAFMLGARSPSVVTGQELAMIRFRVAGFGRHINMLRAFIAEIEKRIERHETVAAPHAPRILLTGCPTGQGSEKLIEIIEECGGIVVCQEACSGIKSVFFPTESDKDPIDAIAERHFKLPCSCLTPNPGRTELIEQLAADFRPDAVVDLVWQACHTYNVESHLVGEFVRKKLGIPYMKIETDYSPSDREQIKVRIGAFLEIAAKCELPQETTAPPPNPRKGGACRCGHA